MPSATTAKISTFPFRVQQIERAEAPSPEEFLHRYRRASLPVVLTGLTQRWRPAADWTPQRIAERYGSANVVAAQLANYTLRESPRDGVLFRRLELQRFVTSLTEPGSAADYVMAPISNLPEAFQQDFETPAYCRGAPHLQAKFWIGKAGTVTPTHRDVPHNLNVHLSGRKQWLLFPPGGRSRMYPRGILSGMPNFSSVDPEQPDFDKYPHFREVTALSGIIGPGETLFIPHGWWHHTRSLDDAVAINFWWGGAVVYAAGLASAWFKRIRGIRRDEWSA